MAQLLQLLIEPPRPCSYLDDRLASLEHRILVGCTPAELELMLERGWRRFGPDHFRPRCHACASCIPTRLPLASHRFSKSERRALRANDGFRVTIGRPRVDEARVALHAKWHAFREDERGWEHTTVDPRHYRLSFAFPHPSLLEIACWDDESPGDPRLISIAITDETPNAWSAVYFFYDPLYARRSPGIANVARQVELAAARGKQHLYLGYRVEGSRSMEYKARFGPAERLLGWPKDDEAPQWVPVEPEATATNR